MFLYPVRLDCFEREVVELCTNVSQSSTSEPTKSRLLRCRALLDRLACCLQQLLRNIKGSLAHTKPRQTMRRLRGTNSKCTIWDQVSTEACKLSQKTDGLYNVEVTQSKIGILPDVVTTHIASLLSLPFRSHTKTNGNHASFNTSVRNCLMIRAISHRAVSSAK